MSEDENAGAPQKGNAENLAQLAYLLFTHPRFTPETLYEFLQRAQENPELVGMLIDDMQGNLEESAYRTKHADTYRKLEKAMDGAFITPMKVEAIAAYYRLEELQRLRGTLPAVKQLQILRNTGFSLIPKPPEKYELWGRAVFECDEPNLRDAIIKHGISNGSSSWIALHTAILSEFRDHGAERQLYALNPLESKWRVRIRVATPADIIWAHHLSKEAGSPMFSRGAFRVRNPGVDIGKTLGARDIATQVNFDVASPPEVTSCREDEISTSLTLGLTVELV